MDFAAGQIITFASFGIIVFYILFFRMRLAYAAKRILRPQYYTNFPVSVVICARNEEENLKKNLPHILSQAYQTFEVVVVDDNSADESYFYLKALQQEHSNLKVIRLNENVNFFSGKKFPLSIGIRSASYDHLLLTDADCMPSSAHWIQLMVSGFVTNKKIVLGYGKYAQHKGLLNILIRFDTLYTAMNYFSFSLAGVPYMGVGRNLAYHKELFNEQKGFSKHYNVVSGDDDLFVNAAADTKNTACLIHPYAFTVSEPRRTWGEWWKQKLRHLKTSVFYRTKHKLLLSLYPLSVLAFYISLVFSVQDENNLYIFLSLLLLKIILDIIVYKKISELLSEKKLYLFSFFIELFLIVFLGLVFLAGIFSKQKKWK
jgi:cellulose synthase/poly-beta-1,6-N-acetylglucosamine synthase-like glycosyltransferase